MGLAHFCFMFSYDSKLSRLLLKQGSLTQTHISHTVQTCESSRCRRSCEKFLTILNWQIKEGKKGENEKNVLSPCNFSFDGESIQLG